MAAREHGGRHLRCGPCLYFHDAHVLVDTPEDVIPLLARTGIDRVDHLLITYWHPDHTAGLRVVEQLSFDLATSGARQSIPVYLNAETERRHADSWRYFERRGYCQLNIVGDGAAFDCGPLQVRTFAYAPGGYLLGFIVADGARPTILTHILGCLVGHTPDELSRRGHDFEFAYVGILLTV